MSDCQQSMDLVRQLAAFRIHGIACFEKLKGLQQQAQTLVARADRKGK